MSTTNINVRVDTELKQSAEELFNDLGLNMSSAITIFLKSAVSHDGIPFELKRKSPNTTTIATLAEYEIHIFTIGQVGATVDINATHSTWHETST